MLIGEDLYTPLRALIISLLSALDNAEKLHAELPESIIDAPLSFLTSTDTGIITILASTLPQCPCYCLLIQLNTVKPYFHWSGI
jgi:hypothetical protein